MHTVLPKGHLSILSKSFRYTPAVETDVAKTFVRVRARLEGERREPSKIRELPHRKVGQ
jgi:hypothetical protein